MTAAYPCGEGYYSQAGAQSCTLCQAGYVCSGTTQAASAYELDANKCGGSKCEIWLSNIYQTAACDAGHYCPTDSLLMIPCPRGTYRDLSDNTPATTVSACINAGAGYYADREGMTSTMISENLCAAGYYCPAGSRDKHAQACPPGTF